MHDHRSSSRQKEAPSSAPAGQAQFLEFALGAAAPAARPVAYEIALPSGVMVRVPGGFCPEELALILEAVREGGGE